MPRSSRHNAKRLGELAELAFIYRAASLGLITMKPHGDSAPYDVVVDNGKRLLKVQVKSVSNLRPGFDMYQIHTCHGMDPKRPYTRDEVDFLAVHPGCDAAWFIIPVEVVAGRTAIYLPRRGGRYQQYREAWQLLSVQRLKRRA